MLLSGYVLQTFIMRYHPTSTNYKFSCAVLASTETRLSRPTLLATRTRSSPPTFYSTSPKTSSHPRANKENVGTRGFS